MVRRSASNALVFLVGVALFAAPLAVPAEAPPDRVEYYVEADWGNYQDQQRLVYANLSGPEKRAFDAARTNESARYNASLRDAPARLTPARNGIDIYNVEYEGEYYLLQVKHFTYEVDLVSQVLPRLGALAAGILLALAAAYRQVVG